MVYSIKKSDFSKNLDGKLSVMDSNKSWDIISYNRKINNYIIQLASRHNCDCCPHLCEIRENTNMCLPYGDFTSDVMFINFIPSEQECMGLTSHTSSERAFLLFIIDKLGFNTNRFYYTDIYKCCRDSYEDGEFCLNNLFREVEIIKPKLIIVENIETAALIKKHSNIQEEISEGKLYKNVTFNGIIKGYTFDMVILPNMNLNGDLIKLKSTLWKGLGNILPKYIAKGA